MRIRKFRGTDAQKVSYLTRRCIREVYPRYYPGKVVEFYYEGNTPKIVRDRSKLNEYYVMAEKGRVLGIMGLQKNEIRNSYVNPTYHRRGIGKRLFKHLEKIARSRKYSSLFVHSSEYAQEFYRSCGFVRKRRVSKTLKGIRLDSILMEKKLT